MPRKSKISPEQWAELRKAWEADTRRGFTWLIREFDVDATEPAMRIRAKREGWKQKNTAKPKEKTQTNKQKQTNKQTKTAEKPVAQEVATMDQADNESRKKITETKKNQLTEREKVFVAEFLVTFNASRSALKAGLCKHASDAIKFLNKPHIQAAIREAVDKRLTRLGIDADQLMQFWADVVALDVNEVMQLRRVPCPLCWSGDGEPQITIQEYMKKREDHYKLRMKLLGKDEGEDIGEYPSPSNFSFIDFRREPNPDCPSCHGVGVERAFNADTRYLSPAAKRAYAGIKRGIGGVVNIDLMSKENASKYLATALGIFNGKQDEERAETAISEEELLKTYESRMKKARERQRAVDVERGNEVDDVIDVEAVESSKGD